ncbi:MAG: glycogen debranching enzyme GlgX, partial [Humibacillus sp.]
MPPLASPDLPPEPGVRLVADGAEFCVYAGHADSVEICLFDTADGVEVEQRVPLRHRAHGFWFDTLAGVGLGQRYAVRVDGAWDPDKALLHNPAKLLLDPYARAIEGEVRLDASLYSHRVGPDLRGELSVRDDRDSAP